MFDAPIQSIHQHILLRFESQNRKILKLPIITIDYNKLYDFMCFAPNEYRFEIDLKPRDDEKKKNSSKFEGKAKSKSIEQRNSSKRTGVQFI